MSRYNSPATSSPNESAAPTFRIRQTRRSVAALIDHQGSSLHGSFRPGESYSYDNSGNNTVQYRSGYALFFTCDALERLVDVDWDYGSVSEYTCDSLGQRIAKRFNLGGHPKPAIRGRLKTGHSQ